MYSHAFEIDVTLFCRLIGVFGFLLYTVGFFMLSTGRLHSSQPIYFVTVLVASSCVLISLYVDFNLSSALIQVFYGVMSLGGIVMSRQRVLR